MKKFILLKIILLNTLLAAITFLCACNNTTDTTKITQEEGTNSVADKEGLPYKKIDNINELELDKITKISAFVQDEEIFTDDKNTISDFCEVIKNLTPNNDIETPTGKNGTHYFGFTQIMAYSGDNLLYTFSLNGGKNNQTVYVDNNEFYFYCDINSVNAEKFSEIYSKIHSTLENE